MATNSSIAFPAILFDTQIALYDANFDKLSTLSGRAHEKDIAVIAAKIFDVRKKLTRAKGRIYDMTGLTGRTRHSRLLKYAVLKQQLKDLDDQLELAKIIRHIYP